MKYIVVGGEPFRVYTGTTTFISIRELGQFETKEEAEECVTKNYTECGGLINLFEIK